MKDAQKPCGTPSDNQAMKCRELLQDLMRDTYTVKDRTLLEVLCQQLTEVKQNLEKAKQKEVTDGSSVDCTGERSCCGESTSGFSNQPGNASKRRKLRNRKGAEDSKRQATERSASSSSANREKGSLSAPVHAELTSGKYLSESTVQLAQALILEKFLMFTALRISCLDAICSFPWLEEHSAAAA